MQGIAVHPNVGRKHDPHDASVLAVCRVCHHLHIPPAVTPRMQIEELSLRVVHTCSCPALPVKQVTIRERLITWRSLRNVR